MKKNSAGTLFACLLSRRSGRGLIGGFALWTTMVVAGSLAGVAQENRYLEIELDLGETRYEGDITLKKLIPMRVVIGPDRWLIERLRSTRLRDRTYFDGTNIFEGRVDIERPTRREIQVGGAGPYGPPEILDITPGRHPLSKRYANLAWTAFASGDYLKTRGRLIPVAGLDNVSIRLNDFAFGFEDETLAFEDTLGLPKQLKLLSSEKLLEESLWDDRILRGSLIVPSFILGVEPKSAYAGFRNVSGGTLFFDYLVASSTNVFGWNLPTRFEAHEFIVSSNGTPQLAYKVLGMVNSVREVEPLDAMPFNDEEYTIRDFRFRHPHKVVDYITYVAKPTEIPPVDDPKLEDLYEKAVDGAELDPRYGKWHPIRLMYEAAEKIEKLVE